MRAARKAIPDPMTSATIDEPSPTRAEFSIADIALAVNSTLKLLIVKEASPSEPGPGLVSVNAASRTNPTGNRTSSGQDDQLQSGRQDPLERSDAGR